MTGRRRLPLESDPAPPPRDEDDYDYALGRVAAEMAVLVRRDERLAQRIESMSIRMDSMEEGANQARGAFKIASWLLGMSIAAVISLGVWLVRTTIVDSQRIEVLEKNSERLQDIQSQTADTLAAIKADLREVRTIQAQEVTRQKENDTTIDRRLEHLEKNRR